LILDEPFSGLDPVSVRLLKDVIAAEKRRGATILFSTHVMAQAEELCDRVVMIHKGRKVLDEPMAKLRRQFDASRVLFEPLAPQAGDVELLRGVPGVASVSKNESGYALRLAPGSDAVAVMRDAAGRIAPARVEIARLRLEDMFVGIVRGDTGESEEALRQHLQGLTTGDGK
jgi:ABC-2 type transport system ATP-binding protein